MPGASVSIVVFAVILAYALYRAVILVNLDDTKVSKKSFLRDLDSEPPFRLFDQGFDIAFGLNNPIDPTYGYVSAKLIDFYYTNDTNGNTKRIKARTEIPIDTCNITGFNFSD